jgi:tripartite-type tricarboxylate transporter receptor subunit TctC
MLQDLIAGQVDMCFDGLGSSAGHIRGGRIKAVAVASEKRTTAFPNLPTAVEGGMADYKVATWYGLWAPKGTPADAVSAMQAAMRTAMASDELKTMWTGLGAETPNLYGADFGRFVSSEVQRWAQVVKASGAKLD